MAKSRSNTPKSTHKNPGLDSSLIVQQARKRLQLLKHEQNLRTITDYAHHGIYLQKPPNSLESARSLESTAQVSLDSAQNTPQSSRSLESSLPESARPLLNLTSNDYLGLARASSAIFTPQNRPNNASSNNASPNNAATDNSATDNFARRFWEFVSAQGLRDQDLALGSGSSRLLSGGSPVWEAFEAHLRTRFAPKSALLFNSGYHCNLSCIAALGRLDSMLILIDESAHASMFDGLMLAKSLNPALRFKRFRHNDVAHLGELLESSHKEFAQILIISEALFSMEGDLCDVAALVALKRAYPNALLYLDEAHSLGVLGANGLGLAESLGLAGEIDFLVLTFGKALGSMGACMLCAPDLRELFVNLARGLIYSTALPPLNVAFSYFAFTLLGELEPKRERIRALSQHARAELESIFSRGGCKALGGCKILGELQIISLVLGANERAIACERALESSGIFAKAIKSPTIPKGSARVRLCLHADLPDLAPLFGALESYADSL